MAQVGGMTCGACTSVVEAALEHVPGVAHASVSLMQQEAKVEFDPAAVREVHQLRCQLANKL